MSPATAAKKSLTLFGGDKGWDAADWKRSDDTVRGGQSKSYLDVCEDQAHFRGTLDITALGGAGFASQRTVDREENEGKWDLDAYAGIQFSIARGDKKRYTFNVKDALLSPDPDTGRERSTISWECDFELPPQTEPGDTKDKIVFIPWSSLTPTYRGRVQKDAKPLDRSSIRRFSVMMRSFFGTQEGDFSLYIRSITAESGPPPPGCIIATPIRCIDNDNASELEKGTTPRNANPIRQPLQISLGQVTLDLRYVLVTLCALYLAYKVCM